jgi:hypothetical protein
MAALKEMVHKHQVGQQLAARIVRNHDDAGARPESGPHVSALVNDDPGRRNIPLPR